MAKIPKIKLSREESGRMARTFTEWRIDSLDYKKEWDSLQEIYWRLYRAEPKEREKMHPWKGAANYFIPLAQSTINTIQSQIYDAVAANDPMMDVSAVEGGDVQDAFALADYYDGFLFRQVINLKQLWNDAILNCCVSGSTAWKPRWDRSLVVRRDNLPVPLKEITKREIYLGDISSTIDEELIKGYEMKETAYVRRVDRPDVDVLDAGRLYFLPDTGADLQWPTCRAYFERCWLTWEDLKDRQRGAGWEFDEEVVKAKLTEREMSEKERLEREKEGLSEDVIQDVLEVDEFYFRWALPSKLQIRYDPDNQFDIEKDKEDGWKTEENDEEGYPEDCIAWWAPALAEDEENNFGIMKVVPLQRIYPDGKRPHKLQFYDRIPGSPLGQGLSSGLRALNEWINASANQGTDFGTLRNLPYFMYSPVSSGLVPDIVGLRPGQGVPVLDPRSVTFPRMTGDNTFWVSQMQLAQMWAEKMSKVTDYTMGRSPATPNAPRTARGQAMMIQASTLSFNRLIGLMVEPVLEMFRSLHALHSKWMRADTQFAKYNPYRQKYENRFVSARTFRNEAIFRMVVNPNRSAQLSQAIQILQNLAPMLQQVNPNGLRLMWKEILQLSGSHFSREFDALWPEIPPQPPPMPGMQPGVPPPPQPQGGLMPMGGVPPEPAPMTGNEGVTIGGVQ